MHPQQDSRTLLTRVRENLGRVLERLAGLSIQSWSYKTEDSIRHIGPTAEDFYAAFGLGSDDKWVFVDG